MSRYRTISKLMAKKVHKSKYKKKKGKCKSIQDIQILKSKGFSFVLFSIGVLYVMYNTLTQS